MLAYGRPGLGVEAHPRRVQAGNLQKMKIAIQPLQKIQKIPFPLYLHLTLCAPSILFSHVPIKKVKPRVDSGYG